MASIGWLHLTDLHFGAAGNRWLWPVFRDEFKKDLERLHGASGPWDFILFTGDLTFSGSVEEFAALDRELDGDGERQGLLPFIASLQEGLTPRLIAVPGNHDLVRMPADSPDAVSFSHWHEEKAVREAFWNRPASSYRRAVHGAFSAFVAWRKHREALAASASAIDWRAAAAGGAPASTVPGDAAWSLEKEGLRLGIVGLNSAFLQLTGADFEHLLDLELQQLAEACGGAIDTWLARHHVTLLLTHHPPAWLSPEAQTRFARDIAPAGRFHAHLYGHMHESAALGRRVAGGPSELLLQGASLFGLEQFGDRKKESRLQGYSAMRLTAHGTQGELRIWPRAASLTQGGVNRLRPDFGFDLSNDDAQASFVERLALRNGPGLAPLPPRPNLPPVTAALPPLPDEPESATARWYVARPEAEAFALSRLREERGAVVLYGPGGAGKTRMLQHLLQRLQAETPAQEDLLVQVDLGRLPEGAGEQLTARRFFQELGRRILTAAGDKNATEHSQRPWQGRRRGTDTDRFIHLISPLLQRQGRLLLVFEHADVPLGERLEQDFFLILRGFVQGLVPGAERLRLFITVSQLQRFLLQDKVPSSFFNAVAIVRMRDFDAREVEDLGVRYGVAMNGGERQALMALLGGHPYLTALAFGMAARQRLPVAEVLKSRCFEQHLDLQRSYLDTRPRPREALRAVERGESATVAPENLWKLETRGLICEEGTRGHRYRVRCELYRRELLP